MAARYSRHRTDRLRGPTPVGKADGEAREDMELTPAQQALAVTTPLLLHAALPPLGPGRVRSGAMSTVALDVDAVRSRFSALQTELVFFDGPGGTQVPDEVIDAISTYFRESNANVSGPYETSRRTEALVAKARLTAADFLGCDAEETIFGANMTTLNFALTRTVARGFREGDEIVVTRLDHDGNVSPWL